MTIEHLDSGEILSQGTAHGDLVYLSGLTATDKSKDVYGQTVEVLDKIDERLAHFGSDKSKLLSVNIWVPDIDTKGDVNRAWTEWLGELNRPARACVEVARLPKDVLVEIDCLALA